MKCAPVTLNHGSVNEHDAAQTAYDALRTQNAPALVTQWLQQHGALGDMVLQK